MEMDNSTSMEKYLQQILPLKYSPDTLLNKTEIRLIVISNSDENIILNFLCLDLSLSGIRFILQFPLVWHCKIRLRLSDSKQVLLQKVEYQSELFVHEVPV